MTLHFTASSWMPSFHSGSTSQPASSTRRCSSARGLVASSRIRLTCSEVAIRVSRNLSLEGDNKGKLTWVSSHLDREKPGHPLTRWVNRLGFTKHKPGRIRNKNSGGSRSWWGKRSFEQWAVSDTQVVGPPLLIFLANSAKRPETLIEWFQIQTFAGSWGRPTNLRRSQPELAEMHPRRTQTPSMLRTGTWSRLICSAVIRSSVDFASASAGTVPQSVQQLVRGVLPKQVRMWNV